MPFNYPADYDPTYYDEAESSRLGRAGTRREEFDLQNQNMPGTGMSDFQNDGTPQAPVKQLGNRLSISQYLDKIRQLQQQQEAMGMPESERAVPTFTNIQGGPQDISQGTLKGGEEVRSYMFPEYKEGFGPELERGPEHRIEKAKKELAANLKAKVTNDLHPQWPDAVSVSQLGDAVDQYERDELRGTRHANSQEIKAIATSLREAAAESQKKNFKRYKDLYGVEGKDIFRAMETGVGDFGSLLQKISEMNTEEKAQQIYKKAFEQAYPKYAQREKMVDQETGEYYPTAEAYAQDAVEDYLRGLKNLQEVIQEMSKFTPEQSQPKGADKNLEAELSKLPQRRGKDGKMYVTYQGQNYLVSE